MMARLTVMVTIVLAVWWPAPAVAHGESTVAPTNYDSEVLRIEPGAAGVTVRADDATQQLVLRNTGATEAVVLGYEREPYLRVGPAGVFANVNSPAFYLNSDRRGGTVPPASANAAAPPAWERLSDDDQVAWHDRRAHWFAIDPPPAVAAAPGNPSVVADPWTMQFTVDGVEHMVFGRLSWQPGPSPLPWYVVASLLTALCALLIRRQAKRMSLVLGALLTVDVFHRAMQIVTIPTSGTTMVGEALELLVPSALAWFAGAHAIRLFRRNDDEAPWFTVFSAVLIGLINGAGQAAVLSSSQVPLVLGAAPARLLVSTTLGLATALVVTGVWRIIDDKRRLVPASDLS